MDNLGKVAYDAFVKAGGSVAAEQCIDAEARPFDELPIQEQAAWVSAGTAVYHQVAYKGGD